MKVAFLLFLISLSNLAFSQKRTSSDSTFLGTVAKNAKPFKPLIGTGGVYGTTILLYEKDSKTLGKGLRRASAYTISNNAYRRQIVNARILTRPTWVRKAAVGTVLIGAAVSAVEYFNDNSKKTNSTDPTPLLSNKKQD